MPGVVSPKICGGAWRGGHPPFHTFYKKFLKEIIYKDIHFYIQKAPVETEAE